MKPIATSPRLALLIALALPAAAAAACSGFSSEETVLSDAGADAGVIAADAAAKEDTGSPADSAIGDAGPKRATWEEPEAIRSTTLSRIVLRLGPLDGEYYYSEAKFGDSTIFHGTFTSDAGSPLTFEGGTIHGEFPSVVTIAASAPSPLYFNAENGAIHGIPVVGAQVTDVASALVRAVDGGTVSVGLGYNPYAAPIAVSGNFPIYFESNNSVVRAEVQFLNTMLLNETAITIVPAADSPTPARPQFPVVSRDEKALYFAADEGANTVAIWMATRLTDPSDADAAVRWVFGDAHRVFRESTANEFPTDLSADGKTLYFTRVESSGATAYRVRQKP